MRKKSPPLSRSRPLHAPIPGASSSLLHSQLKRKKISQRNSLKRRIFLSVKYSITTGCNGLGLPNRRLRLWCKRLDCLGFCMIPPLTGERGVQKPYKVGRMAFRDKIPWTYAITSPFAGMYHNGDTPLCMEL